MEQNQNPQPPGFDPQQYNPPQYNQPGYSLAGRPMMPFWTAVKTCFRKYFDFTGRARRSEYWWFVLFFCIVMFIWIFLTAFITVIGFEAMYRGDMSPFSGIITTSVVMLVPILVFIIPQYAAQTRRLHDTGRSGWWVVASIVVSLAYLVTYFYVLMPLIKSGGDAPESFFSSPMMIVVGLLGLISSILSIVILVFTIMDGERGENKYGPSPKYQ